MGALLLTRRIKDGRFDAKIARDNQDGESMGVRRTPTILLNGRKLVNLGEPGLRDLIEEELNK